MRPLGSFDTTSPFHDGAAELSLADAANGEKVHLLVCACWPGVTGVTGVGTNASVAATSSATRDTAALDIIVYAALCLVDPLVWSVWR